MGLHDDASWNATVPRKVSFSGCAIRRSMRRIIATRSIVSSGAARRS